jgi:hypothetical protein
MYTFGRRGPEFAPAVKAALVATRVAELLRSRPAVVLERIARAAGSTRWYRCRDCATLEALEPLLRSGSVVSFYFDGRIKNSPSAGEVSAAVQTIIERTGEAVFGLLDTDGIQIKDSLVCSSEDLAESMEDAECATEFFYGEFPYPDDDGLNAVTLRLPDSDGVVRMHPV